jgi:uncharacterized protein YbdZ (MbtH family)
MDDETLVAVNRLSANQYQVIELPRHSTETTQSHQLGSQSECLDHIEDLWTEGNYLYVSPQDIADERAARIESRRGGRT